MNDYQIPDAITCPATDKQPMRRALVAGHGIVHQCPNCDRKSSEGIPYFLIEPGNIWTNIVFECGMSGCGAFWALVGSPPQGATVYDEQPAHRPPV